MVDVFVGLPVFYINLASRKDRDEATKATFPHSDLRRLDAFSNYPKPWMGCSASHIEALKRGIATGSEAFVVIEDDLDYNTRVPKTKMRSYLKKALESDAWDVLLLVGYFLEGRVKGWEIPGFSRIEGYGTAAAYVIRRKYAPLLLEAWKASLSGAYECLMDDDCYSTHSIDGAWKAHQKRDHWHCASPVFFVVRPDYSDIDGVFVDHTSGFDIEGTFGLDVITT